jgi:mannosyltransferase
LLGAVFWVASRVAGRVAGLVSAGLAAISPLVLQYAQQARAYSLTMLTLALAAIAALSLDRVRSWGWAIAGGVACAVALSLHYLAALAVVPLCAWMLTRRMVDLRRRLVFCAIPLAAWLAWLPLLVIQQQERPSAQLGEYGTFTPGHLVRVAGTPFDDRYTTEVGFLKVAAAAVVAAAVVFALVRSREADRSGLRLMLVLALVPLAALALGSLVGLEILNSRYATVAAPFMLVVIGSAIAGVRLAAGLGALAVLLAAAIVYTDGSHRPENFYPDTRGVIDAIAADWRPGDVVLEQTTLGVQFPLRYYAGRRLPNGAEVLPYPGSEAHRLLSSRPRAWIVREQGPGTQISGPAGFRTASLRRFPASVDVTLELACPRRPAIPSSRAGGQRGHPSPRRGDCPAAAAREPAGAVDPG